MVGFCVCFLNRVLWRLRGLSARQLTIGVWGSVITGSLWSFAGSWIFADWNGVIKQPVQCTYSRRKLEMASLFFFPCSLEFILNCHSTLHCCAFMCFLIFGLKEIARRAQSMNTVPVSSVKHGGCHLCFWMESVIIDVMKATSSLVGFQLLFQI